MATCIILKLLAPIISLARGEGEAGKVSISQFSVHLGSGRHHRVALELHACRDKNDIVLARTITSESSVSGLKRDLPQSVVDVNRLEESGEQHELERSTECSEE